MRCKYVSRNVSKLVLADEVIQSFQSVAVVSTLREILHFTWKDMDNKKFTGLKIIQLLCCECKNYKFIYKRYAWLIATIIVTIANCVTVKHIF